jgi:hypothetical protein
MIPYPALVTALFMILMPLSGTAFAGEPGVQPSHGESPGQTATLIADGAADARHDFADGVLMLLGGEGLEAGTLDLGQGLQLEIATDACALGPDPAQYIADYNRGMKDRIRVVHGVDVDEVLLRAAP